MKVVTLDGDEAIVELDGVEKTIWLALVDDVVVGDYVIVHAGYALEKLDTAEAEKTLALMRQTAGLGDSFALESAPGDDAYQPEAAPFFPMNFGQLPLPI